MLCWQGPDRRYIPLAATLTNDEINEGSSAPSPSSATFFHGHTTRATRWPAPPRWGHADVFAEEGTLEALKPKIALTRDSSTSM